MSDAMKVKATLREYSVYLRDSVDADVARACDDGAFFIIDSNVSKLYGDLFARLPKERTIVLEPTEENKSIDKCKEIIEELVERRIRKNNYLVAIGGGITQDVTSFVASVLYRGVEWQFVPTTLLAQGDSCIGSKTSINLGRNKNLVGNFYPPSAVYIDTKFLNTLDERDIQSGIGEMMHFYVYAASPYMERVVEEYGDLLSNRSKLREYIRESLAIKKGVAEIDEYDKGERNKFNYGHTFGHALEAISGYELRHGQAVTTGMDLANYISTSYGMMDRETFQRLHGLLKVNIPRYDYRSIDMDAYLTALSKDKKNLGNDLVCILAKKPGELVKHRMAMDEKFQSVVREYFQGVLTGNFMQ